MNRRDFLTGLPAAALGAGANPYRIIDTHVHVFNSTVQGAGGIPKYYPDSTVERQIEQMDRGGVNRAFLISYSAEDVAAEIRKRGQSPAVLAKVASKKYQVDAWKRHQDRFWWFTDHVSPIRETYLEDLERDLDAGAAGVKLLPLFHGLLPDHPGWRPVYELSRKRLKPVILDLSWWYFGRYGFENESAERQKLAASLTTYGDYARLLDPIFREFATVPFSLAHCGTPRTREDAAEIFALIARHSNLSCDLAMIPDYSPRFLEQLVKAVSPRKVMYGTDAPYWFKGPESYRRARQRWTLIAEECPSLSEGGKRRILAENAERFVKNQMP